MDLTTSERDNFTFLLAAKIGKLYPNDIYFTLKIETLNKYIKLENSGDSHKMTITQKTVLK